MFSVLKAAALKRSLMVKTLQQNQRSSISGKPAKEVIGLGHTVFVLCVFAVTLLVPAGWILHHIPEYRQRPR